VSETTDRFNLDTYNQGDDGWSHTDTVELLDELAVETDTITNRPTSGSYDDELFFATDQRILYRWDSETTDWAIQAGLGTETNPIDETLFISNVDASEISVSSAPTENDDVARLSELEGKADDPHANEAHSETFAVEGDEQPPEDHNNTSHTETYVTVDENVENFSTSGDADTVPVSQGDGTLTMQVVGDDADTEIDLINVEDTDSLPDAENLTKPTIAYVQSEDDYTGAFQE